MYSYNVSDAERGHLEDLERTGGYAEKGVFDYVYALRHCYETGRPYIGMFEDDILLAHGWLVRVLLGLQQVASYKDHGGRWLFMRLFNQERSTGWANRHVGGNHEFWIVLGIGLAISVPTWVARRRWRFARTYLDRATICALVLVVNPALVVLFFQAGKASMLPPSPGVFREEFGCCSQAMIFPREQVPSLIEFLEHKQRGQVDLLIRDLAREAGLAQYALYPVQAQHIGTSPIRVSTDLADQCRHRIRKIHEEKRGAGHLEHGIRRPEPDGAGPNPSTNGEKVLWLVIIPTYVAGANLASFSRRRQ